MFASYSIWSKLNLKLVFLKLWVGMHNRPVKVYGYGGASMRKKGNSAQPRQVT